MKTQATRKERISTLRGIGARDAGPALFVVDLWVVIEPSNKSRCGLSIFTSAHLDLQRLDKEENTGPPIVVSARREVAGEGMAHWRDEPDHVSEQLRDALGELSEKTAASDPWGRWIRCTTAPVSRATAHDGYKYQEGQSGR